MRAQQRVSEFIERRADRNPQADEAKEESEESPEPELPGACPSNGEPPTPIEQGGDPPSTT